MTSIDPEKVAVYIRWSTEDQGLGHTLAIQSDACRHYCLSQGWTLTADRIYVDDGWSGGSLGRPAMTRLRSDVAGGRVQAVVVYKLDRLSRNIKEIISLVLDEWDGKCVVRSTMEPIDTASDTGKLTFTLLSSFADFERGIIRARTLSGKRKNAEQGLNAGSPYPFGYERGDSTGTYRIVEAEAAVVRLIYDLYLNGLGCKPIAEHLNRLGVASRSAGPGRRRLSPGLWSNTAVLRVLKNPVYTGKLVYGRSARNPRYGRPGEPCYLSSDVGAQIEVASAHIPPIISAELFRQAEAIRSAKRSPNFGRRAVGSPHLLSGVTWCRCGHSLVGRKGAGTAGSYYWCSGRKNKGGAVCDGGMVRADLLDQLFLDRLEEVYGREAEAITGQWQAELEQRRGWLTGLIRTAAADLTQVEQAQRRLVHDYEAGVLTGAGYQHLYASLGARERRLRSSVAGWRKELQALAQAEAERQQRSGRVVTFRESFPDLSDVQKKLLLHHLVRRVTVYRRQGTDRLQVQIEWTGGA